MSAQKDSSARVVRVAGPVVGAVGLEGVRLYDVVYVGELGMIGEVIRFDGDQVTVQVYEDTSGVRVGETVRLSGEPLVALLGPGLLGQTFDGLQRPLERLSILSGDYVRRGFSAPALPLDKAWDFTPCVSVGDEVGPGDVLGTIPETVAILHRVMVPPEVHGRVLKIKQGAFKVEDVVAVLELPGNSGKATKEITLTQKWPVRRPRPTKERLDPTQPLLTGTRIIDALFPVAKGGSAIIPGGFGTGKTVTEQSLARLADADVVVYVGCGERGNEMAEVLMDFPKLEDPRTGSPLMDRTILIANTSNMPVAAREASIYMGITLAEYYRDMGYDVLLLADSTSRWGEALREISGRLEEMPGEEGYPAYLAARLAEFYERSGRAVCLGRDPSAGNGSGRWGSVTVVGAVSPPGGDFSEPMTQNSMRLAGTFWALDYDLSRRRHFPAINWNRSYSLYDLDRWYMTDVSPEWDDLIRDARALLQREAELLEIVQLVGPEALSDAEQAILTAAQMIREDFLQQSAYHEVDRFCDLEKAFWMMKAILDFYARIQETTALGVSLDKIVRLPVVDEIARMKELPRDTDIQDIQALMTRVEQAFDELERGADA